MSPSCVDTKLMSPSHVDTRLRPRMGRGHGILLYQLRGDLFHLGGHTAQTTAARDLRVGEVVGSKTIWD